MAVKEIAVGYQHQHKNLFSTIKYIYNNEGVKGIGISILLCIISINKIKIIGLFRGLPIQVPRAAIGSGVQLMTFSRCRKYFIEKQVKYKIYKSTM